MLFAGASMDTVFALTPCRMDALLAGAVVALAYTDPVRRDRWTKRAPAVLGACALLLGPILVKEHGFYVGKWMSSIGYTVIDIASASALLSVLGGSTISIPARALSSRLLGWFGKYSYGAYVFHELLRPLLHRFIPAERIAIATRSDLIGVVGYVCLGIGMSMGAAVMSWHVFEKHFLKLKAHFNYGPVEVLHSPKPAGVTG
jgi:peptidoglycan/LPS O-acetylase OafA/YrhL